MKHTDITKQILALHEEDILNEMMHEIEHELKDGVPKSLQAEIDGCLQKANLGTVSRAENVISFKPKSRPTLNTIAETELLAASGQSLSEWFSQPLSFGGAGFMLDIRRVKSTHNEVDLYLTPNQPDDSKMKKTLSSFLGKSINICISNGDVNLLTAMLYIDETGLEAEGRGHLSNVEVESAIKGKISIEIIVAE